jgi:hypothetical protein
MKSWKAWLPWAGLAGLYLLCLRAYYVGFFNDDAFYIIGARSLLQGRYVELNAPGHPPLDNYPPGYPILLAQLAWLAGESLLAAQLLSVALTMACVWLLRLCFAAELPAIVVSAAAAAAALNPLTVSISGVVLSDIPLLAVTLLVLLAARRRWSEKTSWFWARLGALAGYACLVRTSGAALLAALVLCLLLEKRWRAALAAGFSGGAIFGAYLLRNQLVMGRSEARLVKVLAGWKDLRLWDNASFYLHEIFGRALFRWPAGPGQSSLNGLTLILCLTALAAGLRAWGLKGWRKLVPAYLLGYAGVHLLWPQQGGRYMVSILPLVCVLLFLGLDWADRRWKLGGKAVWSALALSLVLSAAPVWSVVSASLWGRTPLTTPPQRTVAWIKQATDIGDVLATEADGRLYLLTGRRTVHLRNIHEPEAFFRWLLDHHVSYVVSFPTDYIMMTPAKNLESDPLPLETLNGLLADESRYEPVFGDEAERAAVYRVRTRSGRFPRRARPGAG